MKRKKFFLAGIIAVAVCAAVALGGCDTSFYYNDSTKTDDGVLIYYNTHSDKAFVARCEWDGNSQNMEFDIPDEISGCKVVRFGGYIGKGYPLAFTVSLPQEIGGLQENNSINASQEEKEQKAQDLIFTINLGKNVNELYYRGYSDGSIYSYASADGSQTAFYKVSYNYVCGEDNPTFYSRDGVLYYKSNDQKADFKY